MDDKRASLITGVFMSNATFDNGALVRNVKTGAVYTVDNQAIGHSDTHVFVKTKDGKYFLPRHDLESC